MMTYLVTRHSGALNWAEAHGHVADHIVEHLDPCDVAEDDVVIGTLPVNLAAQVCGRGARYFHISLHTPAELRGVPLTAEQMEELGATLEEYKVVRV